MVGSDRLRLFRVPSRTFLSGQTQVHSLPDLVPRFSLRVRSGNAPRFAKSVTSVSRTERHRSNGARPSQGVPKLHHCDPQGFDLGVSASSLRGLALTPSNRKISVTRS